MDMNYYNNGQKHCSTWLVGLIKTIIDIKQNL